MVQRTPKHSMRYIIGLMAITATLLGWSGCKNDPGQGNHTDPPKNPVEVKQIDVSFNADSAYAFVAKQVSFGPRIPGSGAHVAAMQYLKTKLESYCDTVYINHGDIRKKDETKVIVNNIVGSFNPASTNRVVLAAHYDTRPMADEDPENPTTPADGANDGGSGVGVLLEIARQLQELHPERGVDLVLFDQEDGGDRRGDPGSWCLGSQFWGQWAKDNGYSASWGIVLDMVGAKGATFAYEGQSVVYNQSLVLDVWRTGQKLGYGAYFLNINGGMITDDHVYMNTFAHIPTIDIIHHDLATANGFPDHWHRHTDNMDAIDKFTLEAVGHTVLHVVMNRR